MTYYKAVRPDGTSFYDPGFRWLLESAPVEGHTVTHPTASIVGEDASRYLSVSVSPTYCTGMRWPCRLLEVEPAGVVTTPAPDSLPDKRAAVAWRIVRELPATDALGPQGVYVAALIERAGRLTREDSQRLDGAWNGEWTVVADAVRNAAWAAAVNAARNAAWAAVGDAVITVTWAIAGNAARSAAVNAARALAVRDLIGTEYYDALTRPWRTAIGPIYPDDL